MVGKIKHIYFRKAKLQSWLFFGISILFVGIFSVLFLGEKKVVEAFGNITWDGEGGDGKWETAANWSDNVLPTSNDDVTIDNATVTLSAGQTANFNILNVGSGTNNTNLILIGNIGTGADINIKNHATTTQQNVGQQIISGGLYIMSGGALTHADNSTSQLYIVNFSAASSTISGSINVDGLGYNRRAVGSGTGTGYGPGGGRKYSGDYGSGAGHGGNGTSDYNNGDTGGLAYCNLADPSSIDMGSGGGGGYDDGGADGGGLIILNITNTLTISGTVTADGENSAGAMGGGAGGGIKIIAGSIAGVPTNFSLSGGDSNSSGGAGGGGCAYLGYTTTNSISPSSAYFYMNGGITGGGSLRAGAGMVLLKQGVNDGDLSIVNISSGTATTTPLYASYAINSLTLSKSANFLVATGKTFTLSGASPFLGDGTGVVTMYGTVNLSGVADNTDTVDNLTLDLRSGGTFSNHSNVNITSDGALKVNAGSILSTAVTSFVTAGILWLDRTAVFTIADLTNSGAITLYNYTANTPLFLDDLIVNTGGTLTHVINSAYPQTNVINISANNITINGGTINVNAKGYAGVPYQHDGIGPAGGYGLNSGNHNTGGGGAHGGNGGHGDYSTSIGTGGTSYCNIDNIITVGSSGGSEWNSAGGAGGGLVILNVTSSLIFGAAHGSITASGENGVNNSAGGAGGGIKIIANEIVGSPTSISVNGGNSGSSNGGGGGGAGCIAIKYSSTNTITSSNITATGGTGHEAGGSTFPNLSPVYSITQLNSAPTLTPTIHPLQTSPSIVTVTTTIADSSDITNLILEYSLDNSTWVSSTLSNVTASDGSVTTSTGSIASIDTDTGPIHLTIEWDISTAPLLNTEDSTVYFRIIPNDGTTNGTTITSLAFSIDNKAPASPGNLTFSTLTNTTALLTFGTPSVDINFKEYKIFYKPTSSGVTTSDSSHTSSTDSNLGLINYNNSPTTLLSNLTPLTQYYINIWAYDIYGNSTSAVEQSFNTSYCGDSNCDATSETYANCSADCPQVSVSWDQMSTKMADNTIVNAVSSYGSSPASAKRIHFDRPIIFTNGNAKVSIPNNVTMTALDTSGVEVSSNVDFTSMTFSTTGVDTSAMPIVAEASMKFGFTDKKIIITSSSESANLTLSLDAGSTHNGEIWNIYRKSAGESSWTFIDTGIVVNGLCTFQTNQLSDFGGGSVFDSITTSTATTTPPLDFNLNLELTSELRMTCPTGQISMGSIPGMTGGEANTSIDCNITTNNPDGYTMLVHASSTGSGTALANTTSPDTHGFENHPVYSGGTFVGSYTNNPASSTFGFAITSVDAPGYFRTVSGSTCGMYNIAFLATGQCWRGFDNTESTDIVIASKTSATTLSGVTTTMHFKSTIGSVSQTDVPIGTYQATIIVTGIQN